MSDTSTRPVVEICGGEAGAEPVRELLPARTVELGGSTRVRRLLPTLGRRMVGAWCFVDHYGPDDVAAAPGMQVPPHPHIGLQTVSWLLEGTVHHRDSLGSDRLIEPGELALMTAGRGIAHAEQSPDPHAPVLHGAQLWVALPDGARAGDPRFEFHADLPVVTGRGLRATVLLGELAEAVSPGRVHTPLVGVDVELDAGADVVLPLEPDFEHAVLTVSGAPDVDGVLEPGSLCYLGCGRSQLRLRAGSGSRLLLLGGVPFGEEIVMWWNFVGRSGDEVRAAREAWQAEIGGTGPARYGAVTGYDGAPLAAPAMPPVPLRPRGRTR
ncbi:pirin family protein [Pseudonocardia benzenivorans]|uniref:Pirin family protein n=1 Tax=Pseudonocardia benzenivorans TaxID=228005 RepID=A0ABW3VNX1_9PSEU